MMLVGFEGASGTISRVASVVVVVDVDGVGAGDVVGVGVANVVGLRDVARVGTGVGARREAMSYKG